MPSSYFITRKETGMYAESKQKIEAIRNEYSSKGDVIFRAAICTVIDEGRYYLGDQSTYENMLDCTDKEIDRIVLECAHKLCGIEVCDLLIYIQKELFVGNEGGMDYQRMKKMLVKCMEWIANGIECSDAASDFDAIGFTMKELVNLGFEYLFDVF